MGTHDRGATQKSTNDMVRQVNRCTSKPTCMRGKVISIVLLRANNQGVKLEKEVCYRRMSPNQSPELT
jgi:hypothetical protein